MSTGTLATTNISPSIPLVNRGLRAIVATYTEGQTAGTYTLDMTKNFLYGLICNDVNKGANSIEKIEIPLQATQGIVKRFIEGEVTGGSITLNFEADADQYRPGGYPIPDPPTSGGLAMEPHFCLWLGFLSSTDQTKMIPYIECPVNLENIDDFNFAKNAPMTATIGFYQTGEGLIIGRSKINKELSYAAPT
jgi:hypothetical protein